MDRLLPQHALHIPITSTPVDYTTSACIFHLCVGACCAARQTTDIDIIECCLLFVGLFLELVRLFVTDAARCLSCGLLLGPFQLVLESGEPLFNPSFGLLDRRQECSELRPRQARWRRHLLVNFGATGRCRRRQLLDHLGRNSTGRLRSSGHGTGMTSGERKDSRIIEQVWCSAYTEAARNEPTLYEDVFFIHPRHILLMLLRNIREHIFCLIPASNDRKYIFFLWKA